VPPRSDAAKLVKTFDMAFPRGAFSDDGRLSVVQAHDLDPIKAGSCAKRNARQVTGRHAFRAGRAI
jgi:hypothetical protein